MGECKLIKSQKGCHRQESHKDFYVDEDADGKLMFGILPLSKETCLWVTPKNSSNEEMLTIQYGDIFLARRSLEHGGGSVPGERLHFLYIEKSVEADFVNHDETTFMD